MDESRALEAVEWLKQNMIPRRENGRLTFDCSARAIWERAGQPQTTFRQWWQRTKKSCKLKEKQDFRVFRIKNDTKPSDVSNKGGRPGNDYLLTADAAKVVMMGDASEAGLTLRWALVDLLNRIDAGDPELIDYMLHRVQSPEQLEKHNKTGHERMRDMYLRQGKSRQWISQRLQGMSVRNEFTGTLGTHGVVGSGYREITDGMTLEICGMKAQALKKARGVVGKSRPARDGMTLVEMCKTSLAEALSIEKLDQSLAFGNQACRHVCVSEARKVAQL